MSDIEEYDTVYLVDARNAPKSAPSVAITRSPRPGAIPVYVTSSVGSISLSTKLVAVKTVASEWLYILNPSEVPLEFRRYLR